MFQCSIFGAHLKFIAAIDAVYMLQTPSVPRLLLPMAMKRPRNSEFQNALTNILSDTFVHAQSHAVYSSFYESGQNRYNIYV